MTPEIGFFLASHSPFALMGSVVDLLTSCSLDICFPWIGAVCKLTFPDQFKHLPRPFWSVSASSLNQHHLQSLIPIHCPETQGMLFHYSNLSGINVIPNPPCLHSAPDWLHSGQFPFYLVDISRLRSRLFRCIRIGNSILCQSLLSSQYRRTFYICIQTEAEGDCIRVGRVRLQGKAVQSHVSTPLFSAHAGFYALIFLSYIPSPFSLFILHLSFSYVSHFLPLFFFFPQVFPVFLCLTVKSSSHDLLITYSFSSLSSHPAILPPPSAWIKWICNLSMIYTFSLYVLLQFVLPFLSHPLPTVSPRAVPLCHWSQKIRGSVRGIWWLIKPPDQ